MDYRMDYLELERIINEIEKEKESKKTEKQKEKERKNFLENTSYIIKEKGTERYVDTIVVRKLKDFIINNIDKNYTSEKIEDQILFIHENYIIYLYD